MTTITIDKELLEQVVNKLLTCWPKSDPLVNELRAALAAPAPEPERKPDCWCEKCRPITMSDMRMVLCPTCGNKRCPHANDHRNDCTGSNESGQPGSSYP